MALESLNFTIFGYDNDDPFIKVYHADIYLKVTLTALYILGLVSCCGLIIVSWFEKSGQAGSYRSLVNQLVSMRLDQLVLYYTFGLGMVVIKRLVGPLPMFLCRISSFFQYLALFNSCHFTILIVATKFCFIYIFKTIPVMDDHLLSTFLMAIVNLWSILAWAGKMYIDKRLTIAEHICSGTWNYNRLEEFQAPLAPIVMSYTIVLYIVLSIAIMIKKKNNPANPQPINSYNNGHTIDLSNLVTTFLSTLFLAAGIIPLGFLNRSVDDPEQMIQNPFIYAYLQMTGVPFNFCLVTVQAAHHFWTNKSFRKAAKRLFFHEQIVAPAPSISANVP